MKVLYVSHPYIGHLKFWDVLYKEPVTLSYSIIFLQKFQDEH